MKILILLALFQIHTVPTFSQLDSVSKDLMTSLIRNQQPDGTIYYTDKLDDWCISIIKKSLHKRKLIGIGRPMNVDTLRLSRKEQKYFDSVINKLKFNYWSDSLFPNSKRIPVDSFHSHISQKNREFHQAIARDTSNNSINFIGKMVSFSNTFQFSPLIYFRNKSLLLFFVLRMCGGDCGIYELNLYKFEDGIYRKWLLINGGAF